MAKEKKRAKKKAGKKSAAKARKGGGKKAKKKAAASAGPKPVGTGSGPGPLEVATRVTALLRDGKTAEVEELWLAKGIESVEGLGASMAWAGKPAVLDKYRTWEADHEIHEMQLEGPWVGATGFALRYRIDVSQKSTGQRSQMEEIAVYTVKNGKIVREEFHFPAGD